MTCMMRLRVSYIFWLISKQQLLVIRCVTAVKLWRKTFQTILLRNTGACAPLRRAAPSKKALETRAFCFLSRANVPRVPDQASRPSPQPSAALASTTAHGGTRQNTSATNATSAAARSRGATIVSVQTG